VNISLSLSELAVSVLEEFGIEAETVSGAQVLDIWGSPGGSPVLVIGSRDGVNMGLRKGRAERAEDLGELRFRFLGFGIWDLGSLVTGRARVRLSGIRGAIGAELGTASMKAFRSHRCW
jgi:hypothetical protein